MVRTRQGYMNSATHEPCPSLPLTEPNQNLNWRLRIEEREIARTQLALRSLIYTSVLNYGLRGLMPDWISLRDNPRKVPYRIMDLRPQLLPCTIFHLFKPRECLGYLSVEIAIFRAAMNLLFNGLIKLLFFSSNDS